MLRAHATRNANSRVEPHGGVELTGAALSDAQLATFETEGYLVVEGAFDRDAAVTMEAALWEELERARGVRIDDSSTWRDVLGDKRLKRAMTGMFTAVSTPRLTAALDALAGQRMWQDRKGWRAPLVTFPQPEGVPWQIPSGGWHTDAGPIRPNSRLTIFRMFAYLVDVRPRGGGTLIVAGSHRVAAEYVRRSSLEAISSRNMKMALRREHPWFADLMGSMRDPHGRAATLMHEGGEVFGVHVRVVELAQSAGDVVIWHPTLLHVAAPNCLRQPRVMLTHSIHLR